MAHIRNNPSFRACPVLKPQPGHAAKFAAIRRHQQRASSARLCCNQDVERPDRRAGPLQRDANVAGLFGVVDVERPHCDVEREKSRKWLKASWARSDRNRAAKHAAKHSVE
jgi:hypothetical protein